MGTIGWIHEKKVKLNHLLTPHTRIKPKWIKDVNVRLETIKILEKIILSKILDNSHSNVFSDISTWARETKEKINKWDYIKIKRFCTTKETINNMFYHRMGEHIHQ